MKCGGDFPVTINNRQLFNDHFRLRRDRILGEARELLHHADGKSWQELAAEKEKEDIFAEPLPLEELLESPMSYPFRLPRSRSADWSSSTRESYLSRWSRENTPTACTERYARDVRRSYTPVRDIADSRVIEDGRRPYSSYSKRTPIGFMTLPYRTSINYAEEEQPIRKYDVFQVRSWSYPIYKYLNHREHNYERPYSLARAYGTTPAYTTPTMTIDAKTRIDGRRGYSGYAYKPNERQLLAQQLRVISVAHSSPPLRQFCTPSLQRLSTPKLRVNPIFTILIKRRSTFRTKNRPKTRHYKLQPPPRVSDEKCECTTRRFNLTGRLMASRGAGHCCQSIVLLLVPLKDDASTLLPLSPLPQRLRQYSTV
ncbi:unnamed protein product, partial [Mesorhabditis spiculigera]